MSLKAIVLILIPNENNVQDIIFAVRNITLIKIMSSNVKMDEQRSNYVGPEVLMAATKKSAVL